MQTPIAIPCVPSPLPIIVQMLRAMVLAAPSTINKVVSPLVLHNDRQSLLLDTTISRALEHYHLIQPSQLHPATAAVLATILPVELMLKGATEKLATTTTIPDEIFQSGTNVLLMYFSFSCLFC